MSDERPNPDDLLALTQQTSTRGQLRVYLGMCPGVGKTYTMLEDATRSDCRDVIIGIVETHGREETAALTAALPSISRRRVAYRGTEIEEFDLDETLRRKPVLVLVDELPHTNAPGSRHPKRWQDVEELLAAGISVWTTLNIQHVESLRDDVMAITGVRVHETVPDPFLGNADEIRVIDLTPDQLRQRLSEGKVYLGERAGAAAEGFFREGNLRALREMALRFATRKVDAEKRDFMRRNLISGPWRAGERFLVAVGPSPHAERLIRITARLARQQDSGWLAVHVETGQTMDETSAAKLASNLSLARSLGGETLSHPCDDPVRGILQVARRENVTQIVAGKNIRTGWWQRLRGGISDRLQSESGRIDLLLVHPGQDTSSQPMASAWQIPGTWLWLRDGALVAGLTIAISLTGFLAEPLLGYRSVAMLYLVAVPLAGLILSRWGVLALAVVGAVAWNFFFTEPRLTFHMAERADLMQLAAMLIVAVVIGQLTHRLRLREQASRTSEERARALYQLTRVTAASPTLEQGVRASLQQIEMLFHVRASLFVTAADGDLLSLGGVALTPRQQAVCRWTLDHNHPAGKFTDTLPESEILALPLPTNGQPSAVLAVQPGDRELASPVMRDLLETFATHLCVLLERDAHLRSRQESALLERSRHFQRALLDHVSHEIKTPVAVIQASVDHLASGTPEPRLLGEIREAAARLARVMTQLATLSRAEAGLVEPTYEICDARDLMEEAVERFAPGKVEVIPSDLQIQTDPAIWETVISNLLLNAIRHGAGPVRFEAETMEKQLVFRVTNSGPPIPPDSAVRIFERFERGKDALAGGLGLGLPIARSFAEILGGKVALVRSDKTGTIFEAVFPTQPPEAK
jgi:two-component system, OmpR family, sensor histidine kinase KdpD